MTSQDLLRIASMDTPKAIFPDREVGCLIAGCEASFIGFAADPIADISMIGEIVLGVKDGVELEIEAD